ncbi:hypothetical protein NYO99_06345 [Pelomonas sp. UHG3]|jgi:hypothetical protein|uniref:Uncharacterized protein n=1 Tax=Roseateles hydrophilus TaxID=2975054 RepID=A0ACC6C827_9BURK|nr:hypothetical protein [Pelomonas sp. UHG3]MCY4744588.1 hypothetical protein [Pelomonas sp. UHG3]
MKPRRWIVPTVIAAALAATVLAYRHPAVMMQLSEQIWTCFG